MTRTVVSLLMLSVLLLTIGCAQSLHQAQRLAMLDGAGDAGYAPVSSYGPGGWWPFGYYGYPGYGWYGGGGRNGGHHDSSPPAPRPTPPANAPPQFKKKS